MDTPEEVSGEVLRITYHDPETTFTVAKLQPHRPRQREEIAIVGMIPQLQVGHTVHCSGQWEEDPRHGRQFKVQKIRFELPKDPSSIQKLLSSGCIRGVGPKTAQKIVTAFGPHTFSILEKEPHRLFDIPGLSQKKAEEIIELWKLHSLHQETILLLLSFGLTETQAMKALKRWGQATLENIQKNPYLLAKEIRGIGFLQADKIATTLGLLPTNPHRIQSALLFFLWEHSHEGHTCVPLHVFLKTSTEKLAIATAFIETEVSSLQQEGELILIRKNDEVFIALTSLHLMERAIAKNIRRLLSASCSFRPIATEKAVVWAEEKFSMSFSEGQKVALSRSLQHKLSIITGGPGTGKSTITKALLAILSHRTHKITLAAPTGRAAKRLMEITASHAHTIHRLLKFDPIQGQFQHNRHNPLDCDVLIVDEMSMVDTQLMHSLMQALPHHTQVIFVGDNNQLPSIGAGTVLKDLIESTILPTSFLTQIHRQSQRSNIVENAHRVNNGQMPWLKNFPGSDFLFFEAKEPHDVRRKVFDLVTRELPERYGLDPKRDIQVMAPMKRGACGIDQCNRDLQSFFSKGWQELHDNPAPPTAPTFLSGDKVLQMKNNYSKEVFNGDIGFVERRDSGQELSISFDGRLVEYEAQELEELALGWAVSVHKYQGSEAPCVVIPLHTQHFSLLSRNLLYTAITRGKKLVVLVGNIKAIAIAVKNTSGSDRWTFLRESILDI